MRRTRIHRWLPAVPALVLVAFAFLATACTSRYTADRRVDDVDADESSPRESADVASDSPAHGIPPAARAFATDPETDAARFVAAGHQALDDHRADLAHRAFRDAVALDPSSNAAWLGLAEAALLLGQPEEAARALDQFEELDSGWIHEHVDTEVLRQRAENALTLAPTARRVARVRYLVRDAGEPDVAARRLHDLAADCPRQDWADFRDAAVELIDFSTMPDLSRGWRSERWQAHFRHLALFDVDDTTFPLTAACVGLAGGITSDPAWVRLAWLHSANAVRHFDPVVRHGALVLAAEAYRLEPRRTAPPWLVDAAIFVLAHDESAIVRGGAAHFLGAAPPTERVIASLRAQLESVDGRLVAEVVRSLIDLGEPAAVALDDVADCLASHDRFVRIAAIDFLGSHGNRADEFVGVLRMMWTDAGVDERTALLGALSLIETPVARELLADAMTADDEELLGRALGVVTAPLIPLLIEHFDDATDFDTRRALAEAIQRTTPDPALAVPLLREWLADDKTAVRVFAVLALGAYGPVAADAVPDVLDAITRLIRSPDPNDQRLVWVFAAQLARIGPTDEHRERQREFFISALADPGDRVAITAARALAAFAPDADAEHALRRAYRTTDANSPLRWHLAVALTNFAVEPALVLPDLIAAMGDDPELWHPGRDDPSADEITTALASLGAGALTALDELVRGFEADNPRTRQAMIDAAVHIASAVLDADDVGPRITAVQALADALPATRDPAPVVAGLLRALEDGADVVATVAVEAFGTRDVREWLTGDAAARFTDAMTERLTDASHRPRTAAVVALERQRWLPGWQPLLDALAAEQTEVVLKTMVWAVFRIADAHLATDGHEERSAAALDAFVDTAVRAFDVEGVVGTCLGAVRQLPVSGGDAARRVVPLVQRIGVAVDELGRNPDPNQAFEPGPTSSRLEELLAAARTAFEIIAAAGADAVPVVDDVAAIAVSDSELAIRAAEALAAVAQHDEGTGQAVAPALQRVLATGRVSFARAICAEALGRVTRSAETRQTLEAALDDPSDIVRAAAARGLSWWDDAEIRTRAREALMTVAETARDERACMAALNRLGELGTEALPLLPRIRQLIDGDWQARRHAIRAHSLILETRALELLQEGDPSGARNCLQAADEVDPDPPARLLYNLACAWSQIAATADERPSGLLGGDTSLRDLAVGKALRALERAIDAGFTDGAHIDTDPDLDPIRDDPRFRYQRDRVR